MVADEGDQHLSDGRPIDRGVSGNPLQRIDSTDPNVGLAMTELVDRAYEPIGELALPSDPPVGGGRHPQEAGTAGRGDRRPETPHARIVALCDARKPVTSAPTDLSPPERRFGPRDALLQPRPRHIAERPRHHMLRPVPPLHLRQPLIRRERLTTRPRRHVATGQQPSKRRILVRELRQLGSEARKLRLEPRPRVICHEARQALTPEVAQTPSPINRMAPRCEERRRIPKIVQIR